MHSLVELSSRKKNEIEGIGESMAKILYKRGGTFTDNKISNCKNQNSCESPSLFLFARNGNFAGSTNACPLCDLSIRSITKGFEVDDQGKCIICNGKQADCIIKPCGHICACSSCLENWFKTNDKCPICRNNESSYKKIFIDF